MSEGQRCTGGGAELSFGEGGSGGCSEVCFGQRVYSSLQRACKMNNGQVMGGEEEAVRSLASRLAGTAAAALSLVESRKA